jgi:hypothetical protein
MYLEYLSLSLDTYLRTQDNKREDGAEQKDKRPAPPFFLHDRAERDLAGSPNLPKTFSSNLDPSSPTKIYEEERHHIKRVHNIIKTTTQKSNPTSDHATSHSEIGDNPFPRRASFSERIVPECTIKFHHSLFCNLVWRFGDIILYLVLFFPSKVVSIFEIRTQ